MDVEPGRPVTRGSDASGAQDLDLHGDVQRRGRLVQNENVRRQDMAMAIMARCNWPPET